MSCIKEDDIAAEGCGIDVAHYKTTAFMLGAFWAGMAGTLFAAKMTIISPGSFTFWDSVLLFAAVILGGGSQAGVIIALMVMMIIRPQGILPPRPRTYVLPSAWIEKLKTIGAKDA